MPYLSVVVPVYNEEDRLERCLESILSQHTKTSIEIVCIDDGSSDDSPAILERFESEYEQVNVIVHERNQGYASTISDGLDHSEGEVVMFIDADSYLAETSLSALVAAFEDGADAVFGHVEVGNPQAGLHPMACMVGKQYDESLNFGGALMAFDRSILLTEGGFDLTAERAGQDVEIRERLTTLGYDVILDEDIVVYSDFPTSLSEVFKRKYLAGKTYVLTYYNNPDEFDLSVLRGFAFFLTFDLVTLISLLVVPVALLVLVMSGIFVWFYRKKTKAVYEISGRLSYVPAYLFYQFIAGQLRVAGYLSEFSKFASLVRRSASRSLSS